MASAEKAGIVQFAGEGFDKWKFRVQTQLAANGVKETLTTEIPAQEPAKAAFLEKDDRAKALLVSYISDDYLEYVQDKNTAKQIWDALQGSFAKKGFGAQNYIRRSLAMLKMEEGTPLEDHFRRFDGLMRQLKDAGAAVTELDMISQLFISLPSCFDVVTTAIENLEDKQLKLATVKTRLLVEEKKRAGREEALNPGDSREGAAFGAKPRGLERNYQGARHIDQYIYNTLK